MGEGFGFWVRVRVTEALAAHDVAAHRDDRVARQEGLEVLGHADGPDTGPAAAVRDAKGLVQVEVAHIGTEVARAAQAHLVRVRVRVGVGVGVWVWVWVWVGVVGVGFWFSGWG